MNIGPIDLNQPSTWRGAIGLLSITGVSLSPELANQIALFAAGLLSLIEMFRNEYATRKEPLPSMELQGAADRTAEPLRPSAPVAAEPTNPPEPSRFSDR